MIINHEAIQQLLVQTEHASKEDIQKVLAKAKDKEALSQKDIAILLNITKESELEQLFEIARSIKEEIYGHRLVIFAPLYVSNYCVNSCTYCGYKRDNDFPRHKLTREEIQRETQIMEKSGHKRIALEAGEDPVNCTIDYILDAIDAVYTTKTQKDAIRRINVNIAATSVENYRRLKDAEIGTYILFQETYHQPSYEKTHPHSLKGDYTYHLTAFDRAMKAGIDDVGGGVLFGLGPWKFEVLAMMMHNAYLEEAHGVGFHTVSVPRLKKAEGMSLDEYPHIIDDFTFMKLVAILRLALPFTGLILSTRETESMRKKLIQHGISQVSAGSCTDVGGYTLKEQGVELVQFETADHRTPLAVLKSLIDDDVIPSYCTACYRSGRTGDRFMRLAKSGQIGNICTPNALMTLTEYRLDYGDDEIREKGFALIDKEIQNIENLNVRALTQENIVRIQNGERDLYL